VLAEETLQKGEVVEIQRRFSAGREALFHAWTDPDALKSWFHPDGVETQLAEVDLRVGGKYRIEMLMPSGSVVVHSGVYEEITHPKKLVFTWLLQNQDCDGRSDVQVVTRVTVRFSSVDSETTDLHLVHEGLPTQKSRDSHEFGWNACIDCLDRFAVTVTSGE